MRAVDIIRKKRDGTALEPAEIEAFVAGTTTRTWPEYQVSALLMAIALRGMSAEEIRTVMEAGRPALPEVVATAPPQPADHALQARAVPNAVVEEVLLHIGSRAT